MDKAIHVREISSHSRERDERDGLKFRRKRHWRVSRLQQNWRQRQQSSRQRERIAAVEGKAQRELEQIVAVDQKQHWKQHRRRHRLGLEGRQEHHRAKRWWVQKEEECCQSRTREEGCRARLEQQLERVTKKKKQDILCLRKALVVVWVMVL